MFGHMLSNAALAALSLHIARRAQHEHGADCRARCTARCMELLLCHARGSFNAEHVRQSLDNMLRCDVACTQSRKLVRGTQLQPCMRALAVMCGQRAYHAVRRRRVPQSSRPARAAPRLAAMPLTRSLHCLAATGCCPTAAWAAKASQRTKATAQGAALLPRFPQRVFLAWRAQSHGRLPPPWRCVSSASLAIRVGKTGWCCGVAGRVRPGTKSSTQAF